MLARCIVQRNLLRADRTVKPGAFLPYPHLELSVIRCRGLTDSHLWRIGEIVCRLAQKGLYGRVEVQVAVVAGQGLKVALSPDADVPNHALITGWPTEKPAQIQLAQELSARAGLATMRDEPA